MCKCKSLWESCYWHCCEKHFCWDEEIALYEEPKEELTRNEQNNNAFDNLAFYDNVALIANRAIFTIEPLTTNPQKPIVDQPRKILRWFEDEIGQNRENENRNVKNEQNNIYTVEEEGDTASADTVDIADIKNEVVIQATVAKSNSNNNTDENNSPPPVPPPTVQLRKKSLQQRRLSRALTLQIERKELPLIRQSSMPKFYLDTPENNQINSCVARTPSMALNTPIRPQSHEFSFDLSSVVQIHKEQSKSKPVRQEVKRAVSMKDKILLKRPSSLVNLQSPIISNHM